MEQNHPMDEHGYRNLQANVRMRAVRPYKARQRIEHSFHEGDVFGEVDISRGDGWYEATNRLGTRVLIPSTHVEEIQDCSEDETVYERINDASSDAISVDTYLDMEPSEKLSANIGPSTMRTGSVQMRAKFPFRARQRNELSFKEGDTFIDVNRNSMDDWYEATDKHGARGLIPSTYVEDMSTDDKELRDELEVQQQLEEWCTNNAQAPSGASTTHENVDIKRNTGKKQKVVFEKSKGSVTKSLQSLNLNMFQKKSSANPVPGGRVPETYDNNRGHGGARPKQPSARTSATQRQGQSTNRHAPVANRQSDGVFVSEQDFANTLRRRPLVMRDSTKQILRKNRGVVVDNLVPDDIMNYLVQEGVFSPDMQTEIMSKPTPKKQAEALLDRLETRGERAYNIFLESLRIDYPFLLAEFAASNEDEDERESYLGPPINGDFLEYLVDNVLKSSSPSKKKRQEETIAHLRKFRTLETVDEIPAHNQESTGRFDAQLLEDLNISNIKLKKDEYVVAIEDEKSSPTEITILTRRNKKLQVPRKILKKYGDPVDKVYYMCNPLLPDEAKKFVQEEMKENPRDGMFCVYKHKGDTPQCEFHICVGEIGQEPENYPINHQEGRYSLKPGDEEVRSFEVITELVEYYTLTRGHVLQIPLGRPLPAETSYIKGVDYDEKWEEAVQGTEVKNKLLGKGNFSEVYRGRIRGQDVALKYPNTTHQSLNDIDHFFREAKVLMELDHQNVVKIVGVRFEKTPCFIAMEYAAKGTLKDLLRKGVISTRDGNHLQDITKQILAGMCYIEEKQYVHRDLAARNILITDNKCVKICDFGMARKLWRIGSTYQATQKEPFAARWAAPETLVTLRFGAKSDVWSLGIVLWEIYSGGQRPYPKLKRSRIFSFVVLENGRNDKPDRCPDYVDWAMRSCWHMEPDRRPTFRRLYQAFITEDYQDIRHQNNDYTTESKYIEEMEQKNPTTMKEFYRLYTKRFSRTPAYIQPTAGPDIYSDTGYTSVHGFDGVLYERMTNPKRPLS